MPAELRIRIRGHPDLSYFLRYKLLVQQSIDVICQPGHIKEERRRRSVFDRWRADHNGLKGLKEKSGAKGEGSRFSSSDEVVTAYEDDEVDLHAKIKVEIDGKIIETTVGRVRFNLLLPRSFLSLSTSAAERTKESATQLACILTANLASDTSLAVIDDC